MNRRERYHIMMAEKLKQVEQAARTGVERKVGTRFVETRYDSISGMVEFNVFLQRVPIIMVHSQNV
jgi:hypothetical protein